MFQSMLQHLQKHNYPQVKLALRHDKIPSAIRAVLFCNIFIFANTNLINSRKSLGGDSDQLFYQDGIEGMLFRVMVLENRVVQCLIVLDLYQQVHCFKKSSTICNFFRIIRKTPFSIEYRSNNFSFFIWKIWSWIKCTSILEKCNIKIV